MIAICKLSVSESYTFSHDRLLHVFSDYLEFRTLNWKIGACAWVISTCVTDIQSWISTFVNVIAPSIGVHDISLVTNTFRTIWSVITSDFISFYKSTWIIGAEIIGDTGSGAIGTGSFLIRAPRTKTDWSRVEQDWSPDSNRTEKNFQISEHNGPGPTKILKISDRFGTVGL